MPVQLRVETADARLSEVIVTTLTAVGHDGIIETIFLADAWLPIDDLQGKLQIPADWLIAEHSVRRLDLDLEWTRAGETGAYCPAGEARSADPAEACNTYDGVLRFFSSVEDPWADEDATPDEIFYGVFGWWTLDG